MKRLRKLYAGASINPDESINFNWKSDVDTDIIALNTDTSGEFVSDNVRYIYGYVFSPNASKQDIKIFRDYLKGRSNPHFVVDRNVEEFVDRGILSIESYASFKDFDVTVHIDSTKHPSLVDMMSSYIMEYSEGIYTDFQLIKETYENVQIDIDKLYTALIANGYNDNRANHEIEYTLKKFEELKRTGELFEMKRFVPKEIRSGFYNFLKFETEDERNLYMSLQGANVLLYDDFLTSGSTIKEAIRYLTSINESNFITVFVLVKQ